MAEARKKLNKSIHKNLRFKSLNSVNPENKKLIKKYVEHRLKDNSRVGKSRLNRIVTALVVCDYWFKKPFSKIDKKDCDKVIKSLIEDKFTPRIKLKNRKERKRIYSEETKQSNIKILKQLLRWIYSNGLNKTKTTFERQFSYFRYIKDKDKINEPIILALEEVELLAQNSSLAMANYFMIALDSGLRPEELLNCKIKDLTWDSKKKKYWINCRFPKKDSKKRNIDIPLCTPYINKYLKSNKDYKNRNVDAPLFDLQYSYITRYFKNKAKELLNRSLKIYDLRHSSIQYYLEIYNRDFIAMANRYGWTYSNVGERLDGYLARSRVQLPDASILIRADTVTELQKEVMNLKRENEAIWREVEKLEGTKIIKK